MGHRRRRDCSNARGRARDPSSKSPPPSLRARAARFPFLIQHRRRRRPLDDVGGRRRVAASLRSSALPSPKVAAESRERALAYDESRPHNVVHLR